MTSLVDANTQWMHACNPPTHSMPVPHAWEAAAGGRPAVVGPHQPPLEVSSPSPRSAAFASICHTPTTTHTFVRIPVPPFCSERHAYPCAPPSSPQAASIILPHQTQKGSTRKHSWQVSWNFSPLSGLEKFVITFMKCTCKASFTCVTAKYQNFLRLREA